MSSPKILKIKIAEVAIKLVIDSKFENIFDLLSQFVDKNSNSNKDSGLKIIIKKSKNRCLNLSRDRRKLIITGYDINNLKNPFNLIGVFQAVFRFISLHSLKKKVFLLHGSTVIFNNKTICFGDDGKSTAKTLSSLECAFRSKKYIGDEYCFFDLKRKEVFSYSFVPIYLPPTTKEHFTNIHRIKFPPPECKNPEVGYFVLPGRLFKVFKRRKLDAIMFTHFYKNKCILKKMNSQKSKNAIKICLLAHLLKFFNASIDELQFIRNTKEDKRKKYKKELVSSVLKEVSIQKDILKIMKVIPCYKLCIRKPCDIIELLKDF